MRALVLALALAVSPVGPLVCDVACAFDDGGHTESAPEIVSHDATFALAVAAGDDDHQCSHPDGPLAVLTSARERAVDLSVSDLPSTTVSRAAGTMIASSAVAAVGWSPPHALSQAVPLRI